MCDALGDENGKPESLKTELSSESLFLNVGNSIKRPSKVSLRPELLYAVKLGGGGGGGLFRDKRPV